MATQIIVNPVTRIEGHAKIVLDLDDQGRVEKGHLKVLEIRGFEKLLEGMELFKMPLITARLCGVCPAAHHLAAVDAIEAGLSVEPPRDAALLRELLYMGHILHSHALSCFVLSGPDVLLGVGSPAATRNVFEVLRLAPEVAKKVLRLRSMGQKTVETVGGRGVHPVTVVPGGITSRPSDAELETMAGWGEEALGLIEELGGVLRSKLGEMATLRDAVPMELPALGFSDGGALSFLRGDLVAADPGGEVRRFPRAAYAENLVEHVMPGSYMKSVRLRGAPEQSYFVGPLARLLVNERLTTPRADALARELRDRIRARPTALDYIEARLVELVFAAERMAQIPGEVGQGPLRTPAAAREGRYVGGVEAPRGILIHDYRADAEGRLTEVNLIVATQNNYDAMDATVTRLARHYLPAGDDNLLMNGMEFALRCFDPCLSCATHVAGRMPLEVELRCGESVRTITRRAP
ncbi:MAG: Ni/Fe hydrogenase subunit alpha [Deltaproteobacteria bacterium]|nr:Ni/Fe hydrogenase subunit alpha [Deltaproteobacteria bacterium]